MSDEVKKNTELKETELEGAAGGATQNRYDPQVCGGYNKAGDNCLGFWNMVNCDHYRITRVQNNDHRVSCAMGYYDYILQPD